jgi:hypothetical protein
LAERQEASIELEKAAATIWYTHAPAASAAGYVVSCGSEAVPLMSATMAIDLSQRNCQARKAGVWPTRRIRSLTPYNSIREKLLDGHAPYPVKNVEIRLQESYGNDTNVWADSDVDIVLKYTGAFYHDLSEMPAEKQQAFTKAYGADAAYGYHHFKTDALKWINGLYKDDVDSTGKKAIKVRGNGNRRNADIIICQEFRRYRDFNGIGREEFAESIAFYIGNQRIENFPKQHSENCTAKHQETGNFKHMVRIFKNMRNRMIENGLLAEGIAPSYLIEGRFGACRRTNLRGPTSIPGWHASIGSWRRIRRS